MEYNNVKYIRNLAPDECLELNFEKSVQMLQNLIGIEQLEAAKNFQIVSPLAGKKNTNWAQTLKIVGINPRITGTYWGIVKYAMTFPEQGIHLMPLFETGDGSLYVQNSWVLNDEFFDKDLADYGFKTSKEQLKFVVNILHALGKIVGFDALAHVDNFSETVILNPSYFEWIKLAEDKKSQDFSVATEMLGKEIETLLIKMLNLPVDFFSLKENERKNILFPDKNTRFNKRMKIRSIIREAGYEPIPVVEHAPMRPVVFDKMEYSPNGDSWAAFRIENKSEFAKIIGSCTPYKFYKSKGGFPVKNAFDKKVVDYFADKIFEFQKEYNFDFLRADMAHNQISHSHNEDKDFKCTELWALVKDRIHMQKPYFATFAEAFWGNYYISGMQDMLNKKFDIVLGENNFMYLDDAFIGCVTKFLTDYREKYRIFPCVTVFTNDGDLPEHDNLYKSEEANECRYFVSMFLNLPSYTGIGFEIRNHDCRDVREYSNPYVKNQEKSFLFGKNTELFNVISDMRTLYSDIREIIDTKKLVILSCDDKKSLCWYYELENNQKLLFALNLNPDKNFILTWLDNVNSVELIYTNSRYSELSVNIEIGANKFRIENIYIGECVVYNING